MKNNVSADIDALLPLLVETATGRRFGSMKRVKAFQAKLDNLAPATSTIGTKVDCLLFRRAFELRAWLDHAKAKLSRSGNSADANTLRRCIARVSDRKRLLVGVLTARRNSSRVEKKNL